MKRHTITYTELNDYVANKRSSFRTCAINIVECKEMLFNFNGEYRVLHKTECILATTSPEEAIHTYNNITKFD